ncbi:hypothetical protein D3C71_1757190 [compost metagenome]
MSAGFSAWAMADWEIPKLIKVLTTILARACMFDLSVRVYLEFQGRMLFSTRETMA